MAAARCLGVLNVLAPSTCMYTQAIASPNVCHCHYYLNYLFLILIGPFEWCSPFKRIKMRKNSGASIHTAPYFHDSNWPSSVPA